jgi:hypothetical protein
MHKPLFCSIFSPWGPRNTSVYGISSGNSRAEFHLHNPRGTEKKVREGFVCRVAAGRPYFPPLKWPCRLVSSLLLFLFDPVPVVIAVEAHVFVILSKHCILVHFIRHYIVYSVYWTLSAWLESTRMSFVESLVLFHIFSFLFFLTVFFTIFELRSFQFALTRGKHTEECQWKHETFWKILWILRKPTEEIPSIFWPLASL